MWSNISHCGIEVLVEVYLRSGSLPATSYHVFHCKIRSAVCLQTCRLLPYGRRGGTLLQFEGRNKGMSSVQRCLYDLQFSAYFEFLKCCAGDSKLPVGFASARGLRVGAREGLVMDGSRHEESCKGTQVKHGMTKQVKHGASTPCLSACSKRWQMWCVLAYNCCFRPHSPFTQILCTPHMPCMHDRLLVYDPGTFRRFVCFFYVCLACW